MGEPEFDDPLDALAFELIKARIVLACARLRAQREPATFDQIAARQMPVKEESLSLLGAVGDALRVWLTSDAGQAVIEMAGEGLTVGDALDLARLDHLAAIDADEQEMNR